MNIHFKTALGYIKRSPFQALAAIFVLTLTFFVTTVLAVLVYSSGNILKYFETRPQIIAFLKDGITPEQISALQNRLTSDEKIKDVRYVSKEEALSIYKTATEDNPLLSELVSPTIFPASLEFSVTNLNFAQEVIDEVKKEGIVGQVGFTASLGGEKTLQDVVSRLKNIIFYIRVGGIGFVAILGASSFLTLLVIISMRINSRKTEVEILDLIGATPGFIKSPIIFEALIYSFFGVFLGWVFAYILWLYLTPNILSYFGEIPILPKGILNLSIMFGIILGAELIIGSLLAFSGSILAVSRARKTR
ncbi:permease-like cell division protein FtsX [Patescibacteria group bacterium]|nr:permease-like cell division protein FtsX [Patescibacteria group bacterium]MBU2036530.1 permease-like cell division protein FtsX [Patescibacteria group bacterium]